MATNALLSVPFSFEAVDEGHGDKEKKEDSALVYHVTCLPEVAVYHTIYGQEPRPHDSIRHANKTL